MSFLSCSCIHGHINIHQRECQRSGVAEQAEWKTSDSKVIELKRPLQDGTGTGYWSSGFNSPKPIYYQPHNSNKQFIIISNLNMQCIIKYDIKKDEYIKFSEIPSKFYWMSHFQNVGHFVDEKNDKLYLFETKKIEKKIFILDLSTAQWSYTQFIDKDSLNILISNVHIANNGQPHCWLLAMRDMDDRISNTLNKVLTNYYFTPSDPSNFAITMKYNFSANRFDLYTYTEVDSDFTWKATGRYVFSPPTVYVKMQNTFIIVSRDEVLYEFNLNDKKAAYMYRVINGRLPGVYCTHYNYGDYDIILGFDSILYLFSLNHIETGIWCFNLWNYKWYKSSKCLPSYLVRCYVNDLIDHEIDFNTTFIQTNNEYVHFYDPNWRHCKISLYDLCNDDLKKDHKIRNTKIVHGFVRLNSFNYYIPNYLSKLILVFYTMFL